MVAQFRNPFVLAIPAQTGSWLVGCSDYLPWCFSVPWKMHYISALAPGPAFWFHTVMVLKLLSELFNRPRWHKWVVLVLMHMQLGKKALWVRSKVCRQRFRNSLSLSDLMWGLWLLGRYQFYIPFSKISVISQTLFLWSAEELLFKPILSNASS